MLDESPCSTLFIVTPVLFFQTACLRRHRFKRYCHGFRSIVRHQEVLAVHSNMFDRRQHTNNAEKRISADQPRVSYPKLNKILYNLHHRE